MDTTSFTYKLHMLGDILMSIPLVHVVLNFLFVIGIILFLVALFGGNMTKNIHIFGGGTFSHVRSHLALAAPAFGTTARNIWLKLHENTEYQVYSELTKMASISSDMVTNDD